MRALMVLVLAVTATACEVGEPSVPTTDPASTSTTGAPATTTSAAHTTTSVPATVTTTSGIDVEFSGGTVSGPDVFEVDLGETVDIWVLSDVDDEMHVHGYDLFFEPEAGVPFNLTFVADVPGIFEVEVHTGHTRLFEIEVRE